MSTDLCWFSIKRFMPLCLNPHLSNVLRIIDHIDLLSCIQKPHVILLAHEADAAGLVDLAGLTVQERTCEDCFIRIAQRHGIALKSVFRCHSKSTVGLAVITL